MFLSILAFLLSLIPSILLFILLKRRKEDKIYRRKCTSAFIAGALCVAPVIAVSGALYLIILFTGLRNQNVLVYNAAYKMISLAFGEEIVKFSALLIVLRKKDYAYSWADIVAVMVIIGTAFGLLEDIPYAVGENAITMLVRGFTMGHVGYGFVMGWFYAKRLHTGKKGYTVIALLLPWLLHGIYDFSLTPELIEWNENMVFIAVMMAILDIVLIILMIRFFLRARKNDRYNEIVRANVS